MQHFQIRKLKKNNHITAFQEMTVKEKIQYIWDYYKLPVFAILTAVCLLVSLLCHKITQKETILYLALAGVSASEKTIQILSHDFLDAEEIEPSKNQIYLYQGLYLTADEDNPNHEYTYASRMKILAAIDAGQMDIVLMNKEAFDAFSQNGYLYDLDLFLSQNLPKLYPRLQPYLEKNTVILEDNMTELLLDEETIYHAETEEYKMGLNLTSSPILKKAGFQDTIYLGIIKNTSRIDTSASYISYLFPAI